MRKARILWGVLTVLAFAGRPALALPTVDEILARIAKAASELNSYSSEGKMSLTEGPRTATYTCTDTGVIIRKDGKVVYKYCQMMKGTVTGPAGEERKVEGRVVGDGK